jgi:hypothetical protein
VDRLPQLLARAIAVTSLVVVAAIIGVVISLWLRGPIPAAHVSQPPRRGAPLLVNDRDGSVYDLNLKQAGLEERLLDEERRSQRLQEELDNVRKDNDRLSRQLRTLEGSIAALRRELARRPVPVPVTPPPANDTTPAPPAEDGGPG